MGCVVSELWLHHFVSSKSVMQNLYAGVPFAMNLFTVALFVAICVSRPVHHGVFAERHESRHGRAPGLAVGLRRWRAPAAPGSSSTKNTTLEDEELDIDKV